MSNPFQQQSAKKSAEEQLNKSQIISIDQLNNPLNIQQSFIKSAQNIKQQQMQYPRLEEYKQPNINNDQRNMQSAHNRPTPGGPRPVAGQQEMKIEKRETLEQLMRAKLQEKCDEMEYEQKLIMNEVGLNEQSNVQHELETIKNEMASAPDDYDLKECCLMLEKLVTINKVLPMYQKWAIFGITQSERENEQFKDFNYTFKTASIDDQPLKQSLLSLFEQGFKDFDKNIYILRQTKCDFHKAIDILLNQGIIDEISAQTRGQYQQQDLNNELQHLEKQLSQMLIQEGLTEQSIAKEISDLKESLKLSKSEAFRNRGNNNLKRWLGILELLIEISQKRIEEILKGIKIDEEFDLDAEIEFLEEDIKRYKERAPDSKRIELLSLQLQKCQQAKQYSDNIGSFKAQLQENQHQLQQRIEPQNISAANQFSNIEQSQIFEEMNMSISQIQPQYKHKQQQAVQQAMNYKFEQVFPNYLQMNEWQRLTVLDFFISKDSNQYQQLLEIDNFIDESEEFKELQELIKEATQIELQRILLNYANDGGIKTHCSMKHFTKLSEAIEIEDQLEQQHHLENPYVLIMRIRELEMLQFPMDLSKLHLKIIKALREGRFDKMPSLYFQVKKQNSEYCKPIETCLKELQFFKRITVIEKILQSLNDFPQSSEELSSFVKLFISIQNDNQIEVELAFRKIIEELQLNEDDIKKQSLDWYFINLYHELNQQLFPELKQLLNEELFFSAFATKQIREQVYSLFIQINYASEYDSLQVLMENIAFDENKQKEDQNLIVQQMLENIHYQDPRYATIIINYLNKTETGKYFSHAMHRMRSLKDLRNKDIQIIEQCIICNDQKPQTINDFMTMNLDWKQETLESQIYNEFKKRGKLSGDKLQMLLFHLIKKRCKFDNFLIQLQQQASDQPLVLTEQTLLNFILIRSDTFLKTKILMACSTFMPVPLLTFQPDFQKIQGYRKQQQLEYRPCIYEELFYIFEKFKACLNFKISANQNRSPQCCTSIANFIFNSNFQQHSNSMANYGTVEIQFDYCLLTPMFIPVADAHGLVDRDILKKLYPLFNIYVIHIFYEPDREAINKHEDILQEELRQIKSALIDENNFDQPLKEENCRSLIFVFEHEEKINEPSFQITNEVIKGESSNLEQRVVRIRISQFERMVDQQKNQLKLFVQNEFSKEINGFQEYREKYSQRIEALECFANFAEEFYNEQPVKNQEEQNKRRNNNIKPNGIIEKIKFAYQRQNYDQEEEEEKSKISRINQLQIEDFNDDEYFDEEDLQIEDQQLNQLERSLMKKIPQKIKDAVEIVKEFFKIIDKNRENLHFEQFLSMNFYFAKICKIDQDLIHNRDLTAEQCEQMIKKKEELYAQIRKSLPCVLIYSFQKIVEHENYIGITFIISKFLEGYLIGQRYPLINKRLQLTTELQNKQLNQVQFENIQQEIQKFTMLIEERSFPIELIFREQYIKERSQQVQAMQKQENQIDIQKVNIFEQSMKNAQLQINQGQPFEIIDGNNFQFVSEIYSMILKTKNENDQICVISFIGPVKSGIFLLLNTIFGIQIKTFSENRYKGVKGCFIDINGVRSRYQKILLFYCEGFQSEESEEEVFEKRIVFFLMCVSHIILFCDNIKLNHTLSEMIKVANDAISQLREQISKLPQVYFIMNSTPSSNEQTFNGSVINLQNALLQLNSLAEMRQQILTIDQNKVFLLPNSYIQTAENDKITISRPSNQYSKQVDKIRDKFIDFLVNSDQNKVANFTISKWLNFASDFWSFTNSFKGITEFNTLKERKQSQLLHQEIMNIISRHFEKEDKKQTMNETIRQRIQGVLQGYQSFGQIPVIALIQKVDQELRPFYKEIEGRIKEQFIEFCDKQNIDTKIKKKRLEQLEQQIRQHILSFQPLINKLIAEFCDQKISKFVADQSLQTSINNLIQNNERTWKPEEANKLFESEWQKNKLDLQVQMKNRHQVFEETYKSVQELYRPNIKAVGSYEMEVQLFKDYSDMGHKTMLKFLKTCRDFIFFIGRQMRLDPMKYIESISKPKEYLMVPEYFYQIRTQEFYNWQKVVEERFNFVTLQLSLNSLFKKKNNMFGPPSLVSPKHKLEEICQDINNEGQSYGVGMTIQFQQIILNFDEKVISPGISKLQNQNQFYLSNDIFIYLVKQVIEQFIAKIKNNITFFFRYQAPNFKALQSQKQGSKNYFEQYQIRSLAQDNIIQHGFPFHPSKYTFSEFSDFNKAKNDSGIELISQNQQKVSLQINKQLQLHDKFFERYLAYLVEPQKHFMNENCYEVETAKTIFYNNIDPETILSKIQQLVLDNIQRLDIKKVGAKSQNIDEILRQIRSSQGNTINEKYCTLDFKLIQRIVTGIYRIVRKIDEELEPYCLKVSEKGIKSLHLIAQSYIISILFELRWLIEQALLIQFSKNKEIQKGLFIAKLTSNDKDMDTAIAKRTAGHLAKFINEEQKKSEIDRFQKAISSEKEIFKLKNIVRSIEDSLIGIAEGKYPQLLQQIQRLDALDDQGQKDQPGIFAVVIKRIFDLRGPDNQNHQLQQNMILIGRNDGKNDSSDDSNIDSDEEESKSSYQRGDVFDQQFNLSLGEAIKFYVHPDLFLQEKFEEQWKNVTEKQLKMSRDKFMKNRAEIVKKIVDYFYELLKKAKLKNLKIAGNIFYPVASDEKIMGQAAGPNSENQLKLLQQKALTEYILRICEGSWKRDSQIEIDEVRLEFSPELSLIYPEDIGFQIERIYSSVLRQNLKGETISNIITFIDQFIKSLTDIIDSNDDLTEAELIGNLYQTFKQKMLGCGEKCPVCNRLCDQDHGELVEDRLHQCDEGHQLMGFSGIMNKSDSTGLIQCCSEFQDDDEILWQNSEIQWKNLKQKIMKEKRWYLEEMRRGPLIIVRERNVKIWNLIGKQICRYYNEQKNIPIKFKKAT